MDKHCYFLSNLRCLLSQYSIKLERGRSFVLMHVFSCSVPSCVAAHRIGCPQQLPPRYHLCLLRCLDSCFYSRLLLAGLAVQPVSSAIPSPHCLIKVHTGLGRRQVHLLNAWMEIVCLSTGGSKFGRDARRPLSYNIVGIHFQHGYRMQFTVYDKAVWFTFGPTNVYDIILIRLERSLFSLKTSISASQIAWSIGISTSICYEMSTLVISTTCIVSVVFHNFKLSCRSHDQNTILNEWQLTKVALAVEEDLFNTEEELARIKGVVRSVLAVAANAANKAAREQALL